MMEEGKIVGSDTNGNAKVLPDGSDRRVILLNTAKTMHHPGDRVSFAVTRVKTYCNFSD